MKIGIIGMGTIGQANDQYYIGLGHKVEYYDIVYTLPFTTHISGDCDIYLICTDAYSVTGAVLYLREHYPNALISIESTVPIGTCRQLAPVIHCPQRYWGDDPLGRGVNRLRTIGATDDRLLTEAVRIYKGMGILTVPFSPIEVVELSKYAENAYRALEIAYAEELSMLCKREGIDFEKVRHAILTVDHIFWFPEVREGIGGECLPMAMEWLKGLKTIQGAIEADREFREDESV